MEEGKPLIGWSKSTVDYALKYKSRMLALIRGMSKKQGKNLPHVDVEDIYMEFLTYLYKCDDYNIEKAVEYSATPGSIISLEGYVHSCLKYCAVRYITNLYKEESHVVRDTVREDEGKEVSLFDTIADGNSEIMLDEMIYKLDNICEYYKYQRYHLGPDVFQLWFIRLKTMQCNKQSKYDDIISVLGIVKSDLVQIERNASKDGIMFNIAKAVTVIGVDKAIDVLKSHVYCYRKIEKIIETI